MWSSQQLAPHPKKNGPEFGPENGPNLGPQTWLSLTAAVCATEQQRQHFTVQRGIKWQAKHAGEERGFEASFGVKSGPIFGPRTFG